MANRWIGAKTGSYATAAYSHDSQKKAFELPACEFEDIATQAMGSALAHMERLAALRRLSSRIREFRGEWERQPHKPVTQNSMSEGEIELFRSRRIRRKLFADFDGRPLAGSALP